MLTVGVNNKRTLIKYFLLYILIIFKVLLISSIDSKFLQKIFANEMIIKAFCKTRCQCKSKYFCELSSTLWGKRDRCADNVTQNLALTRIENWWKVIVIYMSDYFIKLIIHNLAAAHVDLTRIYIIWTLIDWLKQITFLRSISFWFTK